MGWVPMLMRGVIRSELHTLCFSWLLCSTQLASIFGDGVLGVVAVELVAED